MICYFHNIKEFCVISYRRGKNYCIFVSLVKILKQNETDKWAVRMAICLSWTQRFACPGEIAGSLRHLENAGRGEKRRLGDNLEREAEEINPGKLKRETRR
jgi:hypothetical protein